MTIDAYLTRLGGTLEGLGYAAAPLSLFAVAGFVRERYGVAEGRPLVMLLFFAGVASLVGYPAGLSIGGGWRWNNVHILLPLAVPAAVGVAMVGRWGYEAFADDDAISVGLSALVVVVVTGLVLLNGANLVYLTPATGGDTTNILVQHGQPNDDLSTLEAQLDAAADADAGVLYYGNSSMRGSFVKRDPAGAGYNAYTNFQPICTDWSESLPIHWYLAQSGANASCETDRQGLRERLNTDPPAIIVTNAADDSVPADLLDEQYAATTYNLRSKDTSLPKATVYVAD
ncbi:hypothetical protein [Halapricum sp. CBA1109]|uniref:hypothetical protein n=1 Tax=Halapricum sp. CBA1109 TaxID=2668068 RepID=UPI0018D268BA|nr:hypothetical protein [Halapricum sp. CBA1109]